MVLLFFFVEPVYALGGNGDGGQPAGNPIAHILPIVLMFVVVYMLILRPQIKKQKSQQKMIEDLKKGAQIVTSGGIHGVITNLKDDIITVKVAPAPIRDSVKINK